MSTRHERISVRRHVLVATVSAPIVFLLFSGDANEASAACVEGTTTTCHVGTKQGIGECIGGRVVCQLGETPPPPPLPGGMVKPVPDRFDLVAPAASVSPAQDDNGLSLNPQWRFQEPPSTSLLTTDNSQVYCGSLAWKAPCTSFPTTDDNWGSVKSSVLQTFNPIVNPFEHRSDCESGHHNWMPATYTGQLYWESHSPVFEDDDYNFRLVPPTVQTLGSLRYGAGVTGESYLIFPDTGEIQKITADDEVGPINGGAPAPFYLGQHSLGVEFDTDETIDHFTTPWWVSFKAAVDAEGTDKAKATVANKWAVYNMVKGKYAIVSGLFGLDCAHGCFAELHPVFAMAIRVNEDPADETWAIFVRRWGDEGFCSANEHLLEALPNDVYSFRLPSRGSAVQITREVWATHYGAVNVSYPPIEARQGKIVSFNIPPPIVQPNGVILNDEMIHGELHLSWSGASAPLPPPGVPPAIARAGVTGAPRGTQVLPATAGTATTTGTPAVSAGEGLEQLVATMTPAQQQTFFGKFPPKTISKHVAPPKASSLQTSAGRGPAPGPKGLPGSRPTVRAVANPKQPVKDQQLVDALHAVYGPNLDKNLPPRSNPGTTKPPKCVRNPKTGDMICPDGK